MVRCVIIDSMHNLFLGLVREHFTTILGLGRKGSNEKPVLSVALGSVPASVPDKVAKGIATIKTWLEDPAVIRFPSRDLGVKRLMRFNLASLAFVSKELGCTQMKPKPTREDFAQMILDWRFQQIEICDAGVESATKLGSVISVQELSNIWLDIEQILTPSWIASVPPKLGSAAHGKLKADQWRVLGTIHLPVALIKMWFSAETEGDQLRSIRCRAILDMTMSLVSAVIAATSRSLTRANPAEYHRHMSNYLTGLKELFPSYRLHPNHHMALHLDTFLRLFGPVHGWWTFPFERMIGAVQRMPHNGKIGELEETIARAYTRSANLRALMLKPGCPEVVRHSEAIFSRLAEPKFRQSMSPNLIFQSVLGEEDSIYQSLPEDVSCLFTGLSTSSPLQGRLLSNLSLQNVTYSTHSKHRGNSCVLVIRKGAQFPVPVRIELILEVSLKGGPGTYLVVRPFKALVEPSHHDPFASYPFLRAKLWDAELEDREVILPAQVSSHFACLPLQSKGKELIICISLDHVSFVPLSTRHAKAFL
ncbi:hypothetical protein CVT26_005966 [Gymnopilus dilepis]|uniref:DUF4218 domain-containing protein n=1 Tax=Gymnopilus dilepis TaxID=231916 RepID=A0A409Y1Q1_9AGAR|nr:hypothetical protein CVT26_005966 [Gymnopilus dilepis]